ncbi:MAG: helix-turn-helix transcriptional regulator [Oscillospiraceae bacterium]|nr:helix-turn-helix transcriptional regulator [Oscillospiraceae bacterium]
MSRTTNLTNKPPLGAMIGKRLKEINQQQKWLAQEARISKTYLCAIMNGRAIPTLAALKQIAKPLGLDPFDLVAALFGKAS